MTAFGRTQKEEAGYSVTVEVRTLNGRFLDIVLRLPKNYMEFEEPFRKRISQSIRRGRVEVFFQVETTDIKEKAPRINLPLARFYWEQLQELHRSLPGMDSPRLEHLMRVPYLYETREVEADREILKNILNGALGDTLDQVQRMRRQEGEALLQDCLARISSLRADRSLIESRKDVILDEYRRRLVDRIQEVLKEVEPDQNRLLQEVACVAERSDINEELVRLGSHLDQFHELLAGIKAADGRRLDFLAQELHREVNTIGCKTNDLDTVQAVVRMKSEIGKLKEQVQNIE
jgi:uncharacterized protein (TIGR00255 family)